MPATGVADHPPSVHSCNFSFALTFVAHLGCLRVKHNSSMRIVVLHIVLKKPLAFFASVDLSDCSRYLIGFFVFKLNDKFPLGTESILGHACILYEFVP